MKMGAAEREATETTVEINADLPFITPLRVSESKPPNSRKRLERTDGKQTLPGQPYVRLDGSDLLPYLRSSLVTKELDKMSPYLWLITTGGETNISPLHHEETRGRTINLTEYPSPHLVYYYGRIFVKPIPPYMMTKAFWDFISEADQDVYKNRTRLHAHRLLPHPVRSSIPEGERDQPHTPHRRTTRHDLRRLRLLHPTVRARRQRVRLPALPLRPPAADLAQRHDLLRPRQALVLRVQGQWGKWFGRTFGPVVVVFAIISVILNTFKAGLDAAQIDGSFASERHLRVCWGVAQFILIVAAMISSASLLLLVWVFLEERMFALYMMNARRKDKVRGSQMKRTVIR
ncbi:hypothetical protein GE09DRAFT_1093433 [Coniochaeta sp. 2T2.1]|nr:hypothetical protein GE09DRAFT_1093433 [Coniochaeta sp. 2T2.1]